MTRWTDRQVTFTEYTYDEHGRCINSVRSNGMYHYTFSYDTPSRTTTVMDSYGGVSVVRYDDRKRVIAKHDPNGNVTSTTYDERGNKTSITDPEMRRAVNQYDADGNLTASTNAAGETVHSNITNRAGRQLLPMLRGNAGFAAMMSAAM